MLQYKSAVIYVLLTHSCTPTSQGSHHKPIKKNRNSNGQTILGSRWFYRVGRGRGNKQYFIFGLTV